MKNLKQFVSQIISDDEKDHHFTTGEKILYGIIIPLALVAIMGIAGFLDSKMETIASID